jgi:hypothetical protein
MFSRIQSLILGGLLLLSGATSFPQAVPDQLARELHAEALQVQALWREKKIPEAMKILELRIASPGFPALDPNTKAGIFYNLACGASLLGRTGEALATLGVAVGEGFRDYALLNSDTDFETVRRDPGFTALLRIVRGRGDYPWILGQYTEYASGPRGAGPAFHYQSKDDADLVQFRKEYKLEAVAGSGDAQSRLLNLLRWVHREVRHDGNSENPSAKDALSLLNLCRKEGRGVNCRMMATILNEACLALGFKSRILTCLPLDEKDPDCHVITVVWSEDLRKWLYLDPTFEAYFTDPKGTLLSVEEVRSGLGAGAPLALAKEANWNGQKKDPREYLNYMAKNLIQLQSPQESRFGYESGNKERTYIQLNPVRLPPGGKKGITYLQDPKAFWGLP